MSKTRKMIPITGLVALMGGAAYMVVQLGAQAADVTGNFTNAAVAEIRDAQGRAVLQGQFVVSPEDEDDIERKAALKPTGLDADAAGEAEVEWPKTGGPQEIEFSATGLEPGARFTCWIDGREIASVTADKKGKAEVELDVKVSGQ
jgi:hypothetical protein